MTLELFQKENTISREPSRHLGIGSHESKRRRTPAHDINLKIEGGSGSAIYRIRWRSAGREDLCGLGRNPLDTVDYTLRRLVANRRQKDDLEQTTTSYRAGTALSTLLVN